MTSCRQTSIDTLYLADGNKNLFSNAGSHFEVCQPGCVFKLKGEVNSVKNATINIWLNDGVY